MAPDHIVDAITISGVEKKFGRGRQAVIALDGLSLRIPRGKIFGLLGPNGAGKSTLLRIIAGLVRQDKGSVELFGRPPDQASRRRVGMLIEAPTIYPFLTAREHLRMLGSYSDRRLHVDAVLRRVGIFAAADKKAGEFSLGMKQRLGIACTLISRPDAIILDEPTNGLDPDGILQMRALLRELAEQDGTTVLFSSHLLDEVERVCDHIAILRQGRVVVEGDVAHLLDREGRFWLDVDRPAEIVDRLGAIAELADGGLYVRLERKHIPDLLKSIVSADIKVYEAKWVKPDLETVFLSQTRND